MRRHKLTIVLHPDVYAAAYVYADELGENISDVAEAAFAEYLNARGRAVTLRAVDHGPGLASTSPKKKAS